MLQVRDFKKRAKEGEQSKADPRPSSSQQNIYDHSTSRTAFPFGRSVCNEMSKSTPTSAFLCMDMTYITCLLKDGFGFKESTVLKVSVTHPRFF